VSCKHKAQQFDRSTTGTQHAHTAHVTNEATSVLQAQSAALNNGVQRARRRLPQRGTIVLKAQCFVQATRPAELSLHSHSWWCGKVRMQCVFARRYALCCG
jgi:hypothetical protein